MGNVEKAVVIVQLNKVVFGRGPALDYEETQPPRDANVCETAHRLDDAPIAQAVENANPIKAKASVDRKPKRERGRRRKTVLVTLPADQIRRNILGDGSADSVPRMKLGRSAGRDKSKCSVDLGKFSPRKTLAQRKEVNLRNPLLILSFFFFVGGYGFNNQLHRG